MHSLPIVKGRLICQRYCKQTCIFDARNVAGAEPSTTDRCVWFRAARPVLAIGAFLLVLGLLLFWLTVHG